MPDFAENILREHLTSLLNREFSSLKFSYSIEPAQELNRSFRIVFVEKGTAIIQLGGENKIRDTPVPAGSVVAAMPGAPSGVSFCRESFQTLALCFQPESVRVAGYAFTGENPDAATLSFAFHRSSALPPSGRSMLEALRQLANDTESMQQSGLLLTKALLAMVLQLFFSERANGSTAKAAKTWQTIDIYLQNHLAEDLSRQEVAVRFRLNSSYLSSLCRSMTGHGYIDYVNLLRLSRAQLLLELNLSLDEVSERCGFHYTSYFIRVFKKHFGRPPGQYRPPSRR